ncbi:hypothetical protein B0H10DRAFT_1946236 [Mycena sp. CBHHK59/15]|nr:hypothetical protein B0H10DRAFT_1946236 [Mycena sp. CBHHK59/15]
MVKGQFTELQNAHIESFFPDFVEQMDKGVAGAKLMRWKHFRMTQHRPEAPVQMSPNLLRLPRLREENNSKIPDKNPKKSKLQANVCPQRKSTRAQKPTNEGLAKKKPGKKRRGWQGYALVDEDGNEVEGTNSD